MEYALHFRVCWNAGFLNFLPILVTSLLKLNSFINFSWLYFTDFPRHTIQQINNIQSAKVGMGYLDIVIALIDKFFNYNSFYLLQESLIRLGKYIQNIGIRGLDDLYGVELT